MIRFVREGLLRTEDVSQGSSREPWFRTSTGLIRTNMGFSRLPFWVRYLPGFKDMEYMDFNLHMTQGNIQMESSN